MTKPANIAELERLIVALMRTPDTTPGKWFCVFCHKGGLKVADIIEPGGLFDHWRACGVLADESKLDGPIVPGRRWRP